MFIINQEDSSTRLRNSRAPTESLKGIQDCGKRYEHLVVVYLLLEDVFKRIRLFVYYESIKRDLKIRDIYECRCDERLQTFVVFHKLKQRDLRVYYESLKRELRISMKSIQIIE